MDIDQVLANMGDNDESVPQGPTLVDIVPMDQHFTDSDYGIAAEVLTKCDDEIEGILMHLPLGKRVKVSKRRIRACKTPQELRALDRELYRSAGLDPRDYGL